MILACFIGLVSGMDNFVCRDMTCDGNREPFYDVCVSNRTRSSFTVHECRPGFVCDSDIFNNYTNITWDVKCLPIYKTYSCAGDNSLTAGRRCCTENDCKSSVCANGVCSGVSPCADDEDCGQSTYCSDGICIKSLDDGVGCSRDGQCKAGSGCNKGKCVGLLSLNDGEATENEKYCSANLTYNSTCESILMIVNRTLQPNPFECFTVKDYCNYTRAFSNTSLSFEPCLCAGKSNTLGYCSRYVIYEKNYADKMLSYLKYSKSNCGGQWSSTTNPDILLECGSISLKDYLAYKHAFARGRFWNIEQNGLLEECGFIMDIFDPDATFGRKLLLNFMILLLLY